MIEPDAGAEAAPVELIDLGEDDPQCTRCSECVRYVERIRARLVGSYLGEGAPAEGQIVNARIDLRGLTYDDFIENVRRISKGNVIRDARRSDREGFVCRPFVRAMHIPDIVNLNQSKDVRCGRPMRTEYLRGVEEMGGAPKTVMALKPPRCPVHCDVWWGVFAPEPGHRQGKIVTDERLVAYIDFRRIGTLAIYSMILGHGEYLRHGVMFRLHFAIMEWLCRREDPVTVGIEQLMYAGMNQGGEGLRFWKKRAGFVPALLVAPVARAPEVSVSKALVPLGSRAAGLWSRLRSLMGSK